MYFFTMQTELAWRVCLVPLNSGVSATQSHVVLPGVKLLSDRFALCGKKHYQPQSEK